jgi:hypothetical protein
VNRPDPTATSTPAAQAAPKPELQIDPKPSKDLDSPVVSFVGKEPTEEAVLAGAKAFAQGFDGPHPCKTDPCDECLDDSRRVLIAAYKVDGISSAISDTGGDE